MGDEASLRMGDEASCFASGVNPAAPPPFVQAASPIIEAPKTRTETSRRNFVLLQGRGRLEYRVEERREGVSTRKLGSRTGRPLDVAGMPTFFGTSPPKFGRAGSTLLKISLPKSAPLGASKPTGYLRHGESGRFGRPELPYLKSPSPKSPPFWGLAAGRPFEASGSPGIGTLLDGILESSSPGS
jgi:hypothetical protein